MSKKAARLLAECLDAYTAANGGAVPLHEAQTLIDQLGSVAEAAVKYEKATDRLIKTQKQQLKASLAAVRKSARQAEKRVRQYHQNVTGIYRRDLSDVGYANGHQPLAPYSANPYWHGK